MTNPRRIDDIYPLSPVQEGILYHTLEETEPGMYLTQWLYELAGEPEPEAVHEAAARMLDRHTVLRTAFVWEGRDRPVQAVLRDLRLPWQVEDWRQAPAAEVEGRLEAFLVEDRRRGFDLKKPPLLRVTLFRLPGDRSALLWTHHHILLDGWSLQILMEEFSALYGELLGAGPAALEEPRPFGDYIAWLQERTTRDGEAFWRDVLSGFERPTPVPLEPRPEGRNPRESYPQVDHLLSEEETQRVRRFLRRHHLTLATLMQGAWGLLLARYTGVRDVVFGATVSGRPAELEGVETMVGLFINTLPVRLECPPRATVSDWLARIQRLQVDIREWEHLPLRDIRSWSEVPGSLPLFETFVNVNDLRASDAAGSEAGLEVASTRSVIQANYAVSLGVGFEPSLNLRISFDAERFTESSVRRLQRRLRALVLDMTSKHDGPLETLSLLDVSETQQLLQEWSGRQVAEPSGTLVEVIEATVDRVPGELALACGDESLTYRQLDRRANRWARHLRRQGLRPEDRVALLLDRSIELFVAILAVWKAGGAYLVLDPTDPEKRLRDLVTRSGARLLLTRGERTVGASGVIRLDLDEHRSSCEAESPERLEPPLAGSLAYVLYTSGSTGRPKGVAVEHRQLRHYVASVGRRLELQPGMSYLLVSTPAADLGHTSVYGAWATGGSLRIATREEANDPDALAELFDHHSVDVLKIAPSHLSAVLAAHPRPLPLPRERLVVGGEASSTRQVEQWKALVAPGCRVFNHYGPTEATVGAVAGEVSREDVMPPNSHVVPLGRPLDNVRVSVVDPSGRLAPAETPGELWIGGAGVARGYVDEPRITAERFVPDPFAMEPGARAYRTGDQVRWRPDGHLEFLGRIDHQVKVRGFRVELGEVEAALREHPAVERAVATVHGDPPDSRLVAYVTRDPEGDTASGGRALLPNGWRIHHLNEHETRALFEDVFVERNYFRHGVRLPRQGCVIDVGANIGLFSLFVHQHRPDLPVYAFEPAPEAFARLRDNASAHGADIHAFDCGLADRAKTEAFAYYPHYSTQSGLSRLADADEDAEMVQTVLRNAAGLSGSEEAVDPDSLRVGFEAEELTCRFERLSDVMEREGIDRVGLLKIDVQRAETEVLEGIDETDWSRIDQVVVEVHDRPGGSMDGSRVEQVASLLRRRGFVATVDQDSRLAGTDRYNVYGVRPGVEGDEVVAPPESWSEPMDDLVQTVEATPDGLRDFLARRLPEAMVPASIHVLEEFPLTPNGKVDRTRLPDPASSTSREDDRVGPRSPVERQLSELWSDVLDQVELSVDANFFDLGGHSLKAMQLITRIRRDFEVDLSLREFLDSPTIAGLARVIAQRTVERADEVEVARILDELESL